MGYFIGKIFVLLLLIGLLGVLAFVVKAKTTAKKETKDEDDWDRF
ncbi:MAG: hypothetical protein ACTJG1_14380 [Enterococcus gilvus]